MKRVRRGARYSVSVLVLLILSLLSCKSPKVPAGGSSRVVTIDLARPNQTPQAITFKEVRDVSSIPASVMVEFDEGMANPGARFRAGDVIYNETLPHRRLIVAGISDRYCIVSYEKGGFALSQLLTVFEYTPQTARALFVAYANVSNLMEAKTLLESSETKNEAGTSYF